MQRRSLVIGALWIALAGCGVPLGQSSDPRPEVARSYDLRAFNFTAREGLIISEREGYYPTADIVWRGDPLGPRVDQIGEMFRTAADRNRAVVIGRTPIAVDVTLIRFHGVTNRTRYSIGGIYNVIFDMTIRNAVTGEVLEPTRRVVGNLDAPGGERAVRLEESGQTQKVRVTDFLTGLLRAQLV
ncbi:MAG: DUF6778 family protein [Pseudomonadota bacterium]